MHTIARLTVMPAAMNQPKHSRFIFHVSLDFSTYQSGRIETTNDEVAVTAAARNGCGTAARPNLRTTCDAPASADAAIGYQRKTAEPVSFIEPLRHESSVMPAMIMKVATTIGSVIFSPRKAIAIAALKSGVVARIGSVIATPSASMPLYVSRRVSPG